MMLMQSFLPTSRVAIQTGPSATRSSYPQPSGKLHGLHVVLFCPGHVYIAVEKQFACCPEDVPTASTETMKKPTAFATFDIRAPFKNYWTPLTH